MIRPLLLACSTLVYAQSRYLIVPPAEPFKEEIAQGYGLKAMESLLDQFGPATEIAIDEITYTYVSDSTSQMGLVEKSNRLIIHDLREIHELLSSLRKSGPKVYGKTIMGIFSGSVRLHFFNKSRSLGVVEIRAIDLLHTNFEQGDIQLTAPNSFMSWFKSRNIGSHIFK